LLLPPKLRGMEIILPAEPPRRDHLTEPQRSRTMAKIGRRDTSQELKLRRGLWRAGVRGWRCDFAGLPGRPDLVFPRKRLAVFVDGRLWHGHPDRYPGRLSEAWRTKIARNIERDRGVDRELTRLGWQVMRIWDREIDQRLDEVVCVISAALEHAQMDGGR
jgi:DNA mismatch endonuclease (patch repair protein)